jgi:hypothetical protein
MNKQKYNPEIPVLLYRKDGRVKAEHFITTYARDLRKAELKARNIEVVGQ